MPLNVPTGAATVVTMLNRALNNTALSNSDFFEQVSTVGNTLESQMAFARTQAAALDALTDAQFAERVLGNFGVLPNPDLLDALIVVLGMNPKADRGVIVMNLGNLLSGLEGATGEQAIYAAQAVAWNNEVNQSFQYSSDSSNTTPFVGEFPATYTLAAGAASVNEGATATFALSTTNVAAGTEVAYTLSGIDAADLASGSLTGTAVVGADGKATISVALAADVTTEGAEALTVTLDGKSVTAQTTVNDTSVAPAPVFAIAASAASVDEGSAVTFSITNGAANTEYAVKLAGVQAADITGDLVRLVTTDAAGNASITVDVVADSATETAETLTATVIGQTATASVTINDTSVNTPPVVAAGQEFTINEGSAADAAIGAVAATDAQADAITYAIASGNGDGYFAINAATGALSLTAAGAAAIDAEGAITAYTLGVTATDALGNASAATDVTIKVGDISDNAPVATAATAAATEAGAIVTGTLTATDADAVDAGQLVFAEGATDVPGLTVNADGTYSFDPSQNPAAQALTYTDAPLDLVANYTVTDSGGNVTTSTLTITVTPKPLTFTIVPSAAYVEEGQTISYKLVASEAVQTEITGSIQVTPGDGTAGKTAANDFGSGALNPQNVTIPVGQTESTLFNLIPQNDAATEVPESYTATATVAGYTIADVTGQVRDPSTVGGVGQTFTLTTGIDTIPGLIGSAGSTGTDGDDTIVALIDAATPANSSMNALDSINGGLGSNSMTLNVVGDLDYDGVGDSFPGGVTVSNINTVNVRGSGELGDAAGEFDLSTLFGAVGTVNITLATAVATKAAAGTNLNVSGVTGAIIVDGGKNVVVTDNTANQSITVGDTTESAGTVTVTDTNQGTGVITVEGGTDVTVTATVAGTTADVAGGAINVGNGTDQPTGAIKVTQNNTNTGVSTGLIAGSAGQIAFDLAGTVLDTGDTLTFSGVAGLLYTAGGNNVAAAAIATALNGTTKVVNGVTYDITGAGTVITFDAQTNSANDVSVDFGTLASADPDVSGGNYMAITSGATTVDTDGAADVAGFADVTAGAINVKGGTSIDITVNSTSTAAAETADGDIVNGAIIATAGDNTTTVSVVQNNVVSTQTKAAVAGVNDKTVVTFAALAANGTAVVGGLTFTASKALTAEQVAAAFAGLTAADTQTATGPTANGIFTGALAAGYTSGAASGTTVTFTAAQGTGDTLAVGGLTKAFTAGTAGALADTSSNTVTYGQVTVSDDATAVVKTVTVTGYATNSQVLNSAALETLNLSNAGAGVSMAVADSVDTLVLTLSGMGVDGNGNEAVLGFAAAPLTLNVTSTGNNYVDLTAAATKTLNVSGTGVLDIADVALAALETVKVTGTAGLTLNGGESATLTSVDTTGTTGAVTASIKGDTATYAGGAGVDTVTVTNAGTAISKALDLGAGNDVLTLVGAPVVVPGVTLNGGDGTDTLSIDTASAAALDGDTLFAAKLNSFERLLINNAAASTAVDVANLGFANYVTVAGSAGTLTLDNVANNGTVNVAGAPTTGVTVNVKDAATGVADVLNVGLNANAGVLTAANVETIALTVNAGVTATLTADKATTVTLGGTGALGLTLASSGAVTLVDGSAGYSGALTLTAALADLVVKGGSGADFLTANANDVALYGGDGADTLTVAGGLRVNLHGGAGKDTFVINAGASNALDSYTVINGVDSGDVIKFADGNKFISTKIALSVGADETLLNYANQATKLLAENEMGWFQRGGNTFIVLDQTAGAANSGGAADSFDNGVDQIIMITGLVDLGTGASFNVSNILEIV